MSRRWYSETAAQPVSAERLAMKAELALTKMLVPLVMFVEPARFVQLKSLKR